MVSSTAQSTVNLENLDFPDRLKQVIGSRSVRSFAHASGLSDAVVRQYLSGRSEPTRPSLLAIARTAQVSLEWLAAGIGSINLPEELETPEQNNELETGSFAGRLRQAIGSQSARSFARSCNLSDAVLHQYLSGQSEPTRPALVTMARQANVSLNWLATGNPSINPQDEFTDSRPITSPSSEAIGEAFPVQNNKRVRVAEPLSIVIMSRQILEKPKNSSAPVSELLSEFAAELGIKAENLSFVRMVGDSMEPTIHDKDYLTVDTSETNPLTLAEGIYVFEINSTIFTRRIEPMPGGGYQATTDNQRYQPFVIEPNKPSQKFEILGRVVRVNRKP